MTVDTVEPLPLITFASIMSEPLPPIVWVVEGLIPAGDRVLLYGEFGSMKSWLLLDLAIYIAAGRAWLTKFTVPEPRKVLYIDEEMNERTLRRRVKRLGMGAGLEGEPLPLAVLSRVGVTFGPQGAARLLRALAASAFDPDVIIVETFRRVMTGSENEAGEVAAFWRNVEPILKAGKTLIISHHMRKPRSKHDRANRDRASGSTDVMAGPDTAIAVQRLGDRFVELHCEKSREIGEPPPFIVRLNADGEDGPAALRLDDERPAGEGELGQGVHIATAVIAFLAGRPDGTATTGAVVAHLMTQGVPERTAQRALPRLDAEGRIVRVRHGVWGLPTSGQR